MNIILIYTKGGFTIATIRDIAKLADVSPATVSRVLNHDETISVSNATRKKIFEAAESLAYQKPNRTPVKKNKLIFGLFHWYNEYEELNDPYFISIRLGIEATCQEQAVELIKVFNEDLIKNDFSSKHFDGIIILGKFSDEYIEKFKQLSDNIIFVHAQNQNFAYDHVQADFSELTSNVINLIIQKGHSKIGFIGAHEKLPFTDAYVEDPRETTFIDKLSKLDLYNSDYVQIGNFNFKDGYKMTKALIENNLDNLPTCLFIASDTLAIGALRALNEFNLQVPTDIAIISCNNIPNANYTLPRLSTVKIHTELMGQMAVRLLIERVKDLRQVPVKLVVPHEVILRESF